MISLFVFVLGPIQVGLELLDFIKALFSWTTLNGPIPQMGSGISWLANPAIWLAMLLFKDNTKTALKVALIALFLSTLVYFNPKMISFETGRFDNIENLKIGYWLWVISNLPIIIGILIQLKTDKQFSHGIQQSES